MLAGSLLFLGAVVAVLALTSTGQASAQVGAIATLAVVAAGALIWRLARRLERIEGARAEAQDELDRRLSELFSLQELSYVLSESIQLERIVEQVAHFTVRFLEAKGALIALPGEEQSAPLRIAWAEGSLAELAGRVVPEGDEDLVAGSMHRERLELVSGTADRPVRISGRVTAAHAAVVPLRTHGVVVGALVVTDPRNGSSFKPEDVRLLSTVATHAAIVLANARFFELVRTAKEQWETAFDALTEGIAVVDAEGRIRRANRALAQLLRLPLPSAVGQPLSNALVGHSDALMALLDSARRGERPAPMTARSDPLHRLFRITAAPIPRRQDDQPGSVVVLVEDVTEQRALERQLIQNERLAAIGQLVSGVAHELNNPLTSIAGLSEFLLEQPKLGANDREHLRVIHDQADRAGRIVQNLLTFARRGKAELGRVDLNDLVQRTLALMTYDIKLRDITLHRHLQRNLPEVVGDRYALQQVVLNLVTNAAQAVEEAAPDTPREVWVETALEADEVVLRVRDSGPGIPEEHLPQLFDPFFTTKPVGEGTGLGLSISYTIVQNHKGRLTVEQPPQGGGGALFTVSLPVAPADAPAQVPVPEVPHVRYSRGKAGERDQRTILLLDDDPAMQRLVSALFRQEGHTVDFAKSVPEALELAGQKTYDLVIADARAAPTIAHVPDLKPKLLVATGDVRPETNERIARLGVPTVRKPFNLRELREAAAMLWLAAERGGGGG